MNYQEFIKNIYTSLKSINLKQQKLEEHFQTIFQKIEDLDDKVNKVSNKLDDFIDASNRLKEEKSIALSNSLNNIADNLSTIQTEQDDIITTMTDVSNMEDNMSVLLYDFLSREQIVNDEINIDLQNGTTQLDTTQENNKEDKAELNEEYKEEIREDTMEENNKKDAEEQMEENTVLQTLDLSNEQEAELLILE